MPFHRYFSGLRHPTLERLTIGLQQLPHLERVHPMVGGNLLKCLAAADHLHAALDLELGAIAAWLACGCELPLTGGQPPHRLTMAPVQKTPVQLKGVWEDNVRS